MEREQWRCAGTSSGGECVMMIGMITKQVLCVDSWDSLEEML